MSVDLIKAFDASAAEPARSEAPGNGPPFPSLLESTLAKDSRNGSDSRDSKTREAARSNRSETTRSERVDSERVDSERVASESARSERARAESASSDSREAESAADTEAAQSSPDSTPVESKEELESIPRDPEQEVIEWAAESGSVEAALPMRVSDGREGQGFVTAEAVEGRITDLDVRSGKNGRYEEQIEGGGRNDEISREVGDELLAAVEQGEEGEGDEREGRSFDALTARPVQGEDRPSPAPTTADSRADGREAATEVVLDTSSDESRQDQERADAESDRPPQEDPSRNPENQSIGRAESNQLAEVDPNLRPAVTDPEATRQVVQRAAEVVAVDGAGAVASPVAGAVSEVTTTAAPGTPTPPAASDAIAVQTEWLVSRGGGSARLTLHPQSLGEISIRVTLRGDAVDVVMVAQEAAAKGIAEEQSDRLAQAFTNRDLRMEHFEVKRSDVLDLANTGGEEFAQSEPGRDGRNGEDGETDARTRGGLAGRDRSRPIAAMPRILTVAPETGVDLRI